MPNFELNVGGPDAMNWYNSRDEVVQGYIEAMFFHRGQSRQRRIGRR